MLVHMLDQCRSCKNCYHRPHGIHMNVYPILVTYSYWHLVQIDQLPYNHHGLEGNNARLDLLEIEFIEFQFRQRRSANEISLPLDTILTSK